MPSDLEAGLWLGHTSWLSSIHRGAIQIYHIFFERGLNRTRWLRIVLVISLGYLMLAFSHIATDSVSLSVVDILKTIEVFHNPSDQAPTRSNSMQGVKEEKVPSTDSTASTKPTKPNLNIKPYLSAILDRHDTSLPRQSCNDTISSRYNHLKIPQSNNQESPPGLKYFFALNLYKCVDLLPSLIGAVVEAIRYLGPESCMLSIVEGRSEDGTAEVLQGLVPVLKNAGISYTLQHNSIDPRAPGGDRIARLAALRNQALAPLLTQSKSHLDKDPIIIFPNDVSLCLDDLLELIHQKVIQKADVVCSMDWNMGGDIFYDAWIARDIYGEPFFEVLQGWEWKFANNLFPNNKGTKRRFEQRKPFQVYACWNGIAVLNSAPFLKDGIQFRGRKNQDECEIGEPTYLAKDLWNANYTRIITVPSVAVAYNLKEGQQCKDNYGSTSWNVEHLQPPDGQPAEQELITDWKPQPLNMICAPKFSPKWWVSTTS